MSNENIDRNPSGEQSEECRNFHVDETRKFWGMDEKTFCMLMHLSQFANYIFPFAGIVLPIVMWATNKDQSSKIDQNGKNILNFLLCALIYSVAVVFLAVVFAILTLIVTRLPVGFFVAFPFFAVLGVVTIVFPIIGAIKAGNGEYWPYPLCIRFFK